MAMFTVPEAIAGFGVVMESDAAVFAPNSKPSVVGPVKEPMLKSETLLNALAVAPAKLKETPDAVFGTMLSAVLAGTLPPNTRLPLFAVVPPV
jgi:hypothetical protein